MKIWKMDFDLDRYDNFRPKEKWTIEEIKSFDGRGHFNSWHTIQLESCLLYTSDAADEL